jgi:hypothetical protein
MSGNHLKVATSVALVTKFTVILLAASSFVSSLAADRR